MHPLLLKALTLEKCSLIVRTNAAATAYPHFESSFPLLALQLPLVLPKPTGQGIPGKESQKGSCQHCQSSSQPADKLLYWQGFGAGKLLCQTLLNGISKWLMT